MGQAPELDSNRAVNRAVKAVAGFCHRLPLSLGSVSLTSFSPKLEFAALS